MSVSSVSIRSKSGLKGWHVLAILIGFFGSIMAVNVVMAWFAISTFSGLDGNDSYQRGLDYNKTIADAAKQEQLGWTEDVVFMDNGAKVRVSVTSRETQAVAGLAMTGVIGRGATNQFDHALNFRETLPGSYEAETGGLAPGSWLVSLNAEGADGSYRLKERLWLKKQQ